VADRPVILKKAANPAGGKGPEFKANVRLKQQPGDCPEWD